jgi:hypothetical protein
MVLLPHDKQLVVYNLGRDREGGIVRSIHLLTISGYSRKTRVRVADIMELHEIHGELADQFEENISAIIRPEPVVTARVRL